MVQPLHEHPARLGDRLGRGRGHSDAFAAPQAPPPAVRPPDDHARAGGPHGPHRGPHGGRGRPRRGAGHQEGAGPESRRPQRGLRRAARPAGHGRCRDRRPHRLPRRRRRRHVDRRGAPGRPPAAAPRNHQRPGQARTRRPATPPRCCRPAWTIPRATGGSSGARTAGSRASSSSATPRPSELEIDEINTSIYCFRRDLLGPALRRLSPDNAQGEYYLTDVVTVLSSAGLPGGVGADARLARGVRRERPRPAGLRRDRAAGPHEPALAAGRRDDARPGARPTST